MYSIIFVRSDYSTILVSMRLPFDTTTNHAIEHTLHCLLGCGIGEVLGSAIGAQLGWANIFQTLLAVLLAFTFGYGLTFWGARRMSMSLSDARKAAFRT